MDKEVEDFLEHFGVKGMKWGVRKNQNRSAIANAKAANPRFANPVQRQTNISNRTPMLSKPKKNSVRNAALDYASAGASKRQRARSAKKTLRKLEGKSGNLNTRRGRKKQATIDQKKLDAAFQYALAKPRKTIYVTKDGQTAAIKGKKFVKASLKQGPVLFDDIRL
jgi:hypothetical protein